MSRLIIRRLIIALAVIVACGAVALPQPRVTYACSCAPPPPPSEAVAASAAVFAGTVSGISAAGPSDGSLLVTFDLSQTWKGPAGPQLTIFTSGSSASCGYEFAPGAEYLVYSVAQDGRLATGLCSRTAPLEAAGADLAALGAGAPVEAAAGPVTTVDMGIPWLPLVLGGVGVALILALIAGWRRR